MLKKVIKYAINRRQQSSNNQITLSLHMVIWFCQFSHSRSLYITSEHTHNTLCWIVRCDERYIRIIKDWIIIAYSHTSVYSHCISVDCLPVLFSLVRLPVSLVCLNSHFFFQLIECVRFLHVQTRTFLVSSVYVL